MQNWSVQKMHLRIFEGVNFRLSALELIPTDYLIKLCNLDGQAALTVKKIVASLLRLINSIQRVPLR